ncbi:MAG: hypothetical protein ACI8X5_003497 [Planctomycetota bacterium]|jgi:hypothetical protein
MQTTEATQSTQTARELIHAVNNFLNLVVVSGQIALDQELDYTPERALSAILERAESLTELVRDSRGSLLAVQVTD